MAASAPIAFHWGTLGFEGWLFGGYFMLLEQGPAQVQQMQAMSALPWFPAVSTAPLRIIVPLWNALPFAIVPTAYLYWRERRILPGCCKKCGYDLTGNTSGVCPECGQMV